MPILQAWGMTETARSVVTVAVTTRRGRWTRRTADVRARRGPPSRCGMRIVDPETATICPGTTRRPASCRSRSVDRRATTTTTSRRDTVHRGRLAAHRRRGDSTVRQHQAGRPDQGPREVRRRVDQLGRAGEPDHGPPEGGRGRGHRGAPPEWSERPLACVVVEGASSRPKRRCSSSSAAGREVAGARRRRVHRRGAQDVGRQVLQEDASGEVRGLRIPRHSLNPHRPTQRAFSPRPPRRSCRRRAASRPTRWSARPPSAGHAPRGAVGSIGAGRGSGPGRASRTATHRSPRLTPTERVLSEPAWSTAFATSSVITMAASWARSSPMPQSSVAARRNVRADPGPGYTPSARVSLYA